METGLVKKIYLRRELTMTNDELHQIKENRLQRNTDVLYKFYLPRNQQTKRHLHKLVFRPTADINHWIRLIEDNEEKYGNLIVEWIPRETQPPRYEMTIYGNWENLKKFHTEFPVNLHNINTGDDEEEDEEDEEEEALPNVQNLHLGNP
ncbi:hypothetical protein R3I94_008604 [Phoxinus phoxinus]